MTQPHLWYIRRDGEVSGPFPVKQVIQYLILGRFLDTDEASHNRVEWQVIAEIPELMEPVKTAANDESMQRWVDERRQERRLNRLEETSGEQDRRQDEGLAEVISRVARQLLIQRFWDTSVRGGKAGLMVVGAISVIIGVMLVLTPEKDELDDKCSTPPFAGVDLSHCDLAQVRIDMINLTRANLMGAHLHGAKISNTSFMKGNLQYADMGHAKVTNVSFSRARLKGSSLRQASLDGINFIEADLSYVDFRGAKLNDVDFSKARLAFAIWTDGRVCQENSIGQCE